MREPPSEAVGVSWSPAAIPATWVAWKENAGSNGLLAYFQCVEGEGNARATMTFGVVNAVSPFGNPAGYEKPDGLR